VAVRNLRAEYNIGPGLRVQVTVQTGSEEVREVLTTQESLLRTLARIETLAIVAPGEPPAGSAVSVVPRSDAQVCLQLAGTVDVVAERTRIDKDLQKTQKERAQVAGRLDNQAFVARAPAELAEKERLRIAELDDKIAKLQSSLERLSKL